MVVALVLLVVGAAVLYAGAEAAVRGASSVAGRLGLPAFALGALLFGVDLEGLGASVAAAGRGETAIAAGEAFGTVLFLFTAAFGAALVLARRPVPSPSPPMLAAPAIGVAAAALSVSDRHVTRLEGVLLLLLYAAYVWAIVWSGGRRAVEAGDGEGAGEHVGPGSPDPGRRGAPTEAANAPVGAQGWAARRDALPAAALAVAGLAALVVGALVVVAGGSRVATRTGLASGFVGAAILGALTSLDEVLLEVLPVRRGVPELATGNLLGTLAAFTTGVPGLAALVRPLELDGGAMVSLLAVAIVYAIVATTFFVRRQASWGLGAAVLTLYVAWLVFGGTL